MRERTTKKLGLAAEEEVKETDMEQAPQETFENSPEPAGTSSAMPLKQPLSALAARVLGCLIEKEFATPDLYPLSLNALTNACNQRSNRDPVVSASASEVEIALDELRAGRLATMFSGLIQGSRSSSTGSKRCLI